MIEVAVSCQICIFVWGQSNGNLGSDRSVVKSTCGYRLN